MNSFMYEKLAVTNLKNNRKTYVPYIITAILTVMMFYMIDALSQGKGVAKKRSAYIIFWEWKNAILRG